MSKNELQKKPAQGASLEREKGGTAKMQGCTTKTDEMETTPDKRRSYGGSLGTFERLSLRLEGFSHAIKQ